jgi:hypothetical protein
LAKPRKKKQPPRETVDVTNFNTSFDHPVFSILGTLYGPKPKRKPPYDEERRDKVHAELAHELNTGNPNWTYADLLVKELAHWQGRVDAREKASSGMGFYNMFFGDD